MSAIPKRRWQGLGLAVAATLAASCSPTTMDHDLADPATSPAATAALTAEYSDEFSQRFAADELSLGDAQVPGLSVPIRGYFLSPEPHSEPAPLIILSHLRAPSCADESFDYPCAATVPPMRYDRGMLYAAAALSQAGYAVAVPDLAAAFHGADEYEPYDQHELWSQIIGAFVAHAQHDAATEVDLHSVGLVVHSRSATMLSDAADAIAAVPGASLGSVFAYGPAYDTYDPEHMSPPPPDLPYLGVYGDLDADIGTTASQWLGNYVQLPRTQPAAMAVVPGFGHMLINRAAAQLRDDRIGCDVLACPTAAAHEDFLVEQTIAWFDSTIRARGESVIATVPAELSGYPVRWLAPASNPLAVLQPQDFKPLPPATGPAVTQICHYPDPMDPSAAEGRCPPEDAGVVEIPSEVLYTTAARAQFDPVAASTLWLHLAPAGDPPGGGLELSLVVETAAGHEVTIPVDSSHPAVAAADSATAAGRYTVGTLTLELAEYLEPATQIRAVTVRTAGHPVLIRAVQLS